MRSLLLPWAGKRRAERGRETEAKVDEKLRAISARDEKALAPAGVLPRKEMHRIRGGLVQLLWEG